MFKFFKRQEIVIVRYASEIVVIYRDGKSECKSTFKNHRDAVRFAKRFNYSVKFIGC